MPAGRATVRQSEEYTRNYSTHHGKPWRTCATGEAIHHAYSDKAEVVSLPLEFYEEQ